MANNPLFRATVKKGAKEIQVYQLAERDMYCDYADCETKYHKDELIIGSKIKLKNL